MDSPILVDSRVGSKDLAPLLAAAPYSIPVELTTLDYGDIAFTGEGPRGPAWFGIERKRLHDALACMHDGRLAGHQLPGLVNKYEHVYLLFEGMFSVDDVSGVMMEYRNGRKQAVEVGGRRFMGRDWENWITQLELNSGCHVKYSQSARGSARVIANLYKHLQKPWEEHNTMKVIYTAPPTLMFYRAPHITERVAAQFDGVGWTLATRAAESFGSVVDMVTAGERAWMAIDKIGKKKAGDIVRQLRENFNANGKKR